MYTIQESLYTIYNVTFNTVVSFRDDLTSLKYQSLFIKEALRMYSIVPFISRTTDEHLTMGGLTIPVGSEIELNIDAINHRPDVWPDYEVIDRKEIHF